MTDQQRFDAIGYAGNAGIRTPNLDALAADGLRFNHAYSSTPTCTPARSAILTGLSPWYHGMLGYGDIAPRYPYEMPRAMAENGYYAASIGKDHFGWNWTTNEGIAHGYNSTTLYDGLGTGLPPGNPTTDNEFDNYDAWFQSVLPGQNPLATGGATMDWNSWRGAAYVYDEYCHPTAWIGRKAIEFLTTYQQRRNESAAHGDQNAQDAADQPFFLKVSFHRPHSPYDPPARLLNATLPSDLPPIRTGGNWDSIFATDSTCSPNDPDAWCGKMPDAVLETGRRAYYASIAFVDEWVGNITATLKSTGLYDNTFIIFTSDHGDGQSDHYHFRKGYPYEFSSHIPMFVRWPPGYQNVSIPRNSSSDLVTEMRDIFPTVLDIAGVVPPKGTVLDGMPLTCILRDPTGATCEMKYLHRDVIDAPMALAPQQQPSSPASPHHRLTASGPWRQYIDMEHDIVFNNTVHWSALTDGVTKYVFNAYFPLNTPFSEQLFNLTADPYEMTDVSADPSYSSLLQLWRSRMVSQFEAEGRGSDWVQNGKLQRRVQGLLYSPNYPGQ